MRRALYPIIENGWNKVERSEGWVLCVSTTVSCAAPLRSASRVVFQGPLSFEISELRFACSGVVRSTVNSRLNGQRPKTVHKLPDSRQNDEAHQRTRASLYLPTYTVLPQFRPWSSKPPGLIRITSHHRCGSPKSDLVSQSCTSLPRATRSLTPYFVVHNFLLDHRLPTCQAPASSLSATARRNGHSTAATPARPTFP